ncbi:MAG TPA: vanadium-dependent haloperoxidase [Vicinamibacterales bacterium]|nr:vanadium-dependent haloperoxidase [Vicinamibacterales bacterium]
MKRRIVLYIAGLLAIGPALAGADVVLDWNATAVTTLNTQSPPVNPFAQARFGAIVQLAVFEAVNAVTGEYEPYLGIVAPAGASAEAAAIAAAHRVLTTYFPGNAASLDALRANSLAAIPDGPEKEAGIATGESAAAAMIASRANDGSSPPAVFIPTSVEPGQWQLTTGCTGGVFLNWGNVTPFGIPSAAQFIPDPPPALTSTRYAKDYNEVKSVGSASSTERPPDRADVVRFYAASSPTFVFSSVLRQIAAGRQATLTENARALALLNMAINDALVASFATKYHYNYWRPETAIRAGDADDNPRTDPDASFATFIPTPCFPSYPSNHASGSNGGAEILRRLYGAGGHSIELSNPFVPSIAGLTFHYTTFKQITANVDDARVYGGIHFRFDQEVGGRLGREVATHVYKHNLRKIEDRE